MGLLARKAVETAKNSFKLSKAPPPLPLRIHHVSYPYKTALIAGILEYSQPAGATKQACWQGIKTAASPVGNFESTEFRQIFAILRRQRWHIRLLPSRSRRHGVRSLPYPFGKNA